MNFLMGFKTKTGARLEEFGFKARSTGQPFKPAAYAAYALMPTIVTVLDSTCFIIFYSRNTPAFLPRKISYHNFRGLGGNGEACPFLSCLVPASPVSGGSDGVNHG